MIRRNAHIEIVCREVKWNNQFVISMITNITQLIHHVHLDYLRRCPVYCTWWTCYTALCWQSLFDGVSHASAMFSCSRALRSLIIATSQRAKPAKRKWWKGESSPKRVGLGPIGLSAYHKFFKLLQTIPVTGVTGVTGPAHLCQAFQADPNAEIRARLEECREKLAASAQWHKKLGNFWEFQLCFCWYLSPQNMGWSKRPHVEMWIKWAI